MNRYKLIMMKKHTVLAAFAIAGIALSMSACKDLKPNNALIEQMKDSMRVVVPPPCFKAIQIDEHRDVTITVGSKRLFNSTEEEQREIVKTLTDMAVHYFEENNYLDDGKVIFVPNESTVPTDEDPKKEYEVDFTPLLKK